MNTGEIILGQLGFWVRGCLDIKGKYCTTTDVSLSVRGCLIGTNPNRRGNIVITLTAADLYNVKFIPSAASARGEIEEHEDLFVEDMLALMRKKAGL